MDLKSLCKKKQIPLEVQRSLLMIYQIAMVILYKHIDLVLIKYLHQVKYKDLSQRITSSPVFS